MSHPLLHNRNQGKTRPAPMTIMNPTLITSFPQEQHYRGFDWHLRPRSQELVASTQRSLCCGFGPMMGIYYTPPLPNTHICSTATDELPGLARHTVQQVNNNPSNTAPTTLSRPRRPEPQYDRCEVGHPTLHSSNVPCICTHVNVTTPQGQFIAPNLWRRVVPWHCPGS